MVWEDFSKIPEMIVMQKLLNKGDATVRTLYVILLICLASASYASQKAITDTGEEIIIYSDGKWEYLTNSKQTNGSIPFNKNKFEKPKDSFFLLKSTITNSAYWVNTNKWSFNKPKESGSSAEYQFKLKGKAAYGMSISEEIEIPIETLGDLALEYFKNNAPDGKMLRKEYRTVNGKKVLYLEMGGTIQGVNYIYLGYYYSDISGTTQFTTYTSANLVDKYKSEIYDFLNGLATQ